VVGVGVNLKEAVPKPFTGGVRCRTCVALETIPDPEIVADLRDLLADKRYTARQIHAALATVGFAGSLTVQAIENHRRKGHL